ncbi:MAG TPA: type II toxin-antitoxin system VapC family toxin [Pirellulales bacterium]|nr:type II toxin-antitoxin system VapC family toxin [Pirellulales bacterium]
MSILLDTNILTRSSEPLHPLHRIAVDAVGLLLQRSEEILLVPQNFYEFWVVATRATAQNGLGMSPSQAAAELIRFKIDFSVLDDVPAVFNVWNRLVLQYDIKGKNAHDARLVAAMLVHGVSRLLTFNKADFARYQSITAMSPHDIVSPPAVH